MQCPFIYAKIECDDAIAKVKQSELRINCFGEECPIKLWEPKRVVGTFTMGNHCGVIVNICESCDTLHKCKKTGESKDECRQQRIDSIFRKGQVAEPEDPKQYITNLGGGSGGAVYVPPGTKKPEQKQSPPVGGVTGQHET